MKKVIISISLITLISIVGCNYTKNNKDCTDFQIQNTGKIYFDEQVNSFLTDFISETQKDSCIYELYVDKKDRDEYQLSLLCKHINNEYFQQNNPVNYTTVKGKTIFIYSGIEDFINKDTYSSNYEYINQGSPEYICAWYKVILKDTSYIVKTNSDLISPFCIATLKGIVEFDPPRLDKK